jgi:hypothetical protein
MYWTILPHATACIAADRLILLDLRQDRYFQLKPEQAGPMRHWLERGEPGPPPPAVAHLLLKRGISRADDPPCSAAVRQVVRVPQHLMSPIWQDALYSRAKVIGVAFAIATAKTILRVRPLAEILANRVHMSSSRRPVSPATLSARSAAFDQARTLVPVRRNCLPDTLALDAWLGEDARDCQLVFGVTAAPFKAHCWLQAPHAVLNDSYDHVSRYTPILAL